MSTAPLKFDPAKAAKIRWSVKGTCGNAGCTDIQCCCALCDKPIGVPEEDPRWNDHPWWCSDCDICRDSVPIIVFHAAKGAVSQASFHVKCFESLLEQKEAEGKEASV